MRSLTALLSHLFHPQRSNNHRARLLHPEVIAILIAFACVSVGVAKLGVQDEDFLGSILGYASDITVEKVVAATNAERSKYGLPALAYNSQLSSAALSKGQDMFNNQYWAHTSPAGKEPWSFIQEAGYVYQVAGENLARDFMTTPDMLTAWMASPTHKANIVNSRYNEIGVAVINGNLLGVDTTLVVQMFGKQRETVVQRESVPVVPIAKASTQEPAGQTLPATTELEDPSALNESADENISKPSEEIENVPTKPSVTEEVIAQATAQESDIFSQTRLTPLQLSKALLLSIIFLLLVTLVLDVIVMRKRNTVRLVGKNLAHIAFLTVVGLLVVLFKGGVIG